MKKLLLTCALLFAVKSQAQTNLYVDSSVATSGTGTSWTTAYKTLNEALNTANGSSTTIKYVINVAKGTYYPTGIQNDTTKNGTFLVARGGVQIFGGFPSGGGIRNASTNLTTFSGNIGSPTSMTDNSHHIMVIANIASTQDSVVIDGFTFIGAAGHLNPSSAIYNSLTVSYDRGSAIYIKNTSNGMAIANCVFSANNGKWGTVYIESASPYISNCNFYGNTAEQGGAIASVNAGTNINNCTFQSNNSSYYGGAFYSSESSTSNWGTISNCTFSNNSVTSSSPGYGGAVYDGTYSLNNHGNRYVNCVFSGNTGYWGGGMYYSGTYSNSDIKIDTCVFSGNVAYRGGGLYLYQYGAYAYLSSCTFNNNKSNEYGGGIFVSSSYNSSTSISSSSFYNDSSANGGGLYGGPINATDCIFSSNKADRGAGIFSSSLSNLNRIAFSGNNAAINGGGLYASYNSNNITNCVFSGNKAGINGGGMYDSLDNSNGIITNCTFAGDTALNGNGLYCNSASPKVLNSIIWDGASNSVYATNNSAPVITYSTVQGGFTGTGNNSNDPLFVAPLSTATAPISGGNYSLKVCSPAINTGLNSGSYTGVLDLAKKTRLVQTTVDRGAYEYQGYPLPAITGSNSVCVNATITLGNDTAGGAWSSSNTAIATVNSTTGAVTGVGAGTATITYTITHSAGCTDYVTKTITVYGLPTVSAISGIGTVCVNGTMQFNNSTPGGVWTSNNNSIAMVNATGLVTGITSGTTTISYSVSNSNGCITTVTKVITVNPLPAVTPITGNTSLCIFGNTQLNNATTGGSWSAVNPLIATVNGAGLVTSTSIGTAGIVYTFTDANGCTNTATTNVTVNALPAIAQISGSNVLCANSVLQLSNTTTGGNWSTNGSSIATVNTTGLVTAVNAGSTIINYSITDNNGCSNTVSKVITVAPVYNQTKSATICQGSAYNFGSQVLTTAGTYSHVFQSANGCDSTVVLTLSVNNVNASIIQSGTKLTATPAGATYQWINCINKKAIAGQTSQIFTANQNGQYAVIVTQNGCSDTSACITVSGLDVSVIANTQTTFKVYPNPTNEFVMVTNDKKVPQFINLMDVTGKLLQQIKPKDIETKVDLTKYQPGIYLIQVIDGVLKQTFRVSLVN